MPVTISGSGTITGIATGGLPDGSIAAGDLASSLDLTGKTVTLPSGTGGKILQVKTTIYDTVTSEALTLNSHNEMPFNVTITPASTSSQILISVQLFGEGSDGNVGNGMVTVNRKIGATNNYLGPSVDPSNRNRGLGMSRASNPGDYASSPDIFTFNNYLDSPDTTSEITYIPTIRTGSSAFTWYYNRTANATDTVNYERGVSWITVMEVAG